MRSTTRPATRITSTTASPSRGSRPRMPRGLASSCRLLREPEADVSPTRQASTARAGPAPPTISKVADSSPEASTGHGGPSA